MAELDLLKTKTTELLAEGRKQGLLSDEEYTWRAGHVGPARDVAELDALVSDLLDEPAASARGVPGVALRSSSAHLSVLGNQRVASERLARQDTALTVLGSLELDYRQFPFGAHQSLQIVSVLGEAHVLVPPGVRIKSTMVPILGETSQTSPENALPADAPVLEITAVAILGSLRIEYRKP